MAVRLADHHPAHHPGGRLPQRRHPAPEPAAAGDPAGQGPRVGAAGGHGPGQGVRLLAGPLLADLLEPGLRAGRHLRRRARLAARPRAAVDHRPAVLRAVHLQHLAARLGGAGGGRGPVGLRGHHRRHGLSRLHRGRAGQAERVDPRGALHPQQHRGHPPGPRPQPRGAANVRGQRQRDRRVPDHQPRDGCDQQHPAAGQECGQRHVQQAAGLPGLHRLQPAGERPIPHHRRRRQGHRDPGGGLEPRPEPVPGSLAELGRPAHPLHPRIRRGAGPGQLGQRLGRARTT